MRSGVMWRLFLFVLAVKNDPVWASGSTRGLPTDDKVPIVGKPSQLLFGSCPKLPAPIMNVRLQALKTKSGTIFRRKAVTDDAFACLAALGSQPLAVSSIQECSEQAVAAGLKMFRWDGGVCTGYTNGIPVNTARCAGAGSVVLYSVDVEAISPVVSNLTLSFKDISLINATWDVTPNSCFVMYRVSFNNKVTFVSDKLATDGLKGVPPCAEFPFTVTPVDSNSAVLGPAATVEVVTGKALELSLNLTHGVTAAKASWGAEYTCNPSKQPFVGEPIKSYSVTLGSQTNTTGNSTFEFTFGKKTGRCTDTPNTLSPSFNAVFLSAFDNTGKKLDSATVTFTNDNMPGHRKASSRLNCIYYQTLEETPGGVGFTYDQLQEFCQKTMLSNIYINEGSLSAYATEITSWANLSPQFIVTPHYVGLKRNSTSGKWKWLTGSEMAVPSGWWATGEPSTAGNCAHWQPGSGLAASSCDATDTAAVCYDFVA